MRLFPRRRQEAHDEIPSCLGAALLLAVRIAAAQQPQPGAMPQSNSSFIDAQGTAHITRVVPVPARRKRGAVESP